MFKLELNVIRAKDKKEASKQISMYLRILAEKFDNYGVEERTRISVRDGDGDRIGTYQIGSLP
jgi:hypothetical protein